jgi:serine/threonine protein kinase
LPTTPQAPETENGEGADLALGSIIANKYVVEGVLGSGGVGVVVVARHTALDQLVAIKYLKKEWRTSPTLVGRFIREGRLAAQIRSEHVVKVHDIGELEETGPFIVMEHLEGKDLSHAVQEGGIPVALAVGYVLQACDALAEAHALGIVHRDIKPANLFLAEGRNQPDAVKLIDFGISKVMQAHRDGTRLHLTGANERFGTPVYMSPEQLRCADDVDARADIWALGVVLYELITGELPFGSDDIPQLCTSILMELPRRPSMDLPPPLEAAIFKCLEKDPQNRFSNIAALAQELAPFAPSETTERLVSRITKAVTPTGLGVPLPQTPSEPNQVSALRKRVPAGSKPGASRTTVTSAGLKPWALSLRNLAVALAIGAVAVVGGGSLIGIRSARVEGPAASGTNAGVAGPSPAPAPIESAPPAPAPTPESLTPARATSTTTAMTAHPTPGVAHGPRSPASQPPPAIAASSPPTGITRRALYGERK